MLNNLQHIIGFEPILNIRGDHYIWQLTSILTLHYHPKNDELNFFKNAVTVEASHIKNTTIDEVAYVMKYKAFTAVFD